MNLSTFLMRVTMCSIAAYGIFFGRFCNISLQMGDSIAPLEKQLIAFFVYGFYIANTVAFPVVALFIFSVICYVKTKKVSYFTHATFVLIFVAFVSAANEDGFVFSEMNFRASLYLMTVALCFIYISISLFVLRKKGIITFT